MAVGSAHLKAPREQAVIQRAVEGDPQRFGTSGRRHRQYPAGGIDVVALLTTDVVSVLGGGPEWKSLGVTESAADDQPEWLARAERVAAIVMADQAALDPGGVKQHGQPKPGSVPQLVLGRQQGSGDIVPVVSGEPYVLRGATLAHRRGELQVKPEQVARHLSRGRADTRHLGHRQPGGPGANQDRSTRPPDRDRIGSAVKEREAR